MEANFRATPVCLLRASRNRQRLGDLSTGRQRRYGRTAMFRMEMDIDFRASATFAARRKRVARRKRKALSPPRSLSPDKERTGRTTRRRAREGRQSNRLVADEHSLFRAAFVRVPSRIPFAIRPRRFFTRDSLPSDFHSSRPRLEAATNGTEVSTVGSFPDDTPVYSRSIRGRHLEGRRASRNFETASRFPQLTFASHRVLR